MANRNIVQLIDRFVTTETIPVNSSSLFSTIKPEEKVRLFRTMIEASLYIEMLGKKSITSKVLDVVLMITIPSLDQQTGVVTQIPKYTIREILEYPTGVLSWLIDNGKEENDEGYIINENSDGFLPREATYWIDAILRLGTSWFESGYTPSTRPLNGGEINFSDSPNSNVSWKQDDNGIWMPNDVQSLLRNANFYSWTSSEVDYSKKRGYTGGYVSIQEFNALKKLMDEYLGDLGNAIKSAKFKDETLTTTQSTRAEDIISEEDKELKKQINKKVDIDKKITEDELIFSREINGKKTQIKVYGDSGMLEFIVNDERVLTIEKNQFVSRQELNMLKNKIVHIQDGTEIDDGATFGQLETMFQKIDNEKINIFKGKKDLIPEFFNTNANGIHAKDFYNDDLKTTSHYGVKAINELVDADEFIKGDINSLKVRADANEVVDAKQQAEINLILGSETASSDGLVLSFHTEPQTIVGDTTMTATMWWTKDPSVLYQSTDKKWIIQAGNINADTIIRGTFETNETAKDVFSMKAILDGKYSEEAKIIGKGTKKEFFFKVVKSYDDEKHLVQFRLTTKDGIPYTISDLKIIFEVVQEGSGSGVEYNWKPYIDEQDKVLLDLMTKNFGIVQDHIEVLEKEMPKKLNIEVQYDGIEVIAKNKYHNITTRENGLSKETTDIINTWLYEKWKTFDGADTLLDIVPNSDLYNSYVSYFGSYNKPEHIATKKKVDEKITIKVTGGDKQPSMSSSSTVFQERGLSTNRGIIFNYKILERYYEDKDSFEDFFSINSDDPEVRYKGDYLWDYHIATKVKVDKLRVKTLIDIYKIQGINKPIKDIIIQVLKENKDTELDKLIIKTQKEIKNEL